MEQKYEYRLTAVLFDGDVVVFDKHQTREAAIAQAAKHPSMAQFSYVHFAKFDAKTLHLLTCGEVTSFWQYGKESERA